jgi:hypothetical protein
MTRRGRRCGGQHPNNGGSYRDESRRAAAVGLAFESRRKSLASRSLPFEALCEGHYDCIVLSDETGPP